jgi:CDP-diacylglycerol--glycerol-3-phosphate 3-phosphatidyltransferase
VLAWVCLAGGALVSYAKARAEAVGATANGGIAERAERMIIVGLGAILFQFVDWGMTLALAVLAVLTVITVIQRGLDVRSQLKPRGGQEGEPAGPAGPDAAPHAGG